MTRIERTSTRYAGILSPNPLRTILHSIGLVFLVATTAGFAQNPVRTEVTPDGIRFGWIGEKPSRPMPTVFFFAGDIESNLTDPEYSEGVKTLRPHAWCVTIDLPGHGDERRPGEPGGLDAWRFRLQRKEDVVAYLVKRASAVLDHLVDRHYTDPRKVGVFGTSRGGYMALQFAAADARVRAIAAFAPVTDLTALREFESMTDDGRIRALAAGRVAERLYDRAIWIVIGSTDHRVGTEGAIEFNRRVVEAAVVKGVRPRTELHIEPTEGHRVPAHSYLRAAEWMLQQFETPAAPPT